jgi:hypothetical protein
VSQITLVFQAKHSVWTLTQTVKGAQSLCKRNASQRYIYMLLIAMALTKLVQLICRITLTCASSVYTTLCFTFGREAATLPSLFIPFSPASAQLLHSELATIRRTYSHRLLLL